MSVEATQLTGSQQGDGTDRRPCQQAFERRQRRMLVTSTAVNTLGNGAYLPLALLLLTAVTGLPLVTVGVVLTLAELVALPLLPLTGSIIDRTGAGRMQTLCHVSRCAGFALYLCAHTVGTFAAAALIVAAAERSSRVCGPAVIAETLAGEARERYLAMDRALSNAGLGVGGGLAAVLLSVGGRSGFVAVTVVTSVCFAVAAIVTSRLRCVTCGDGDAAKGAVSWRTVLADRPFRRLTVANMCSAFGYVALAMLIPLYAITVLHLPPPLGGALFTLNTVLCATGSVPISGWLARRGLHSARRACLGLLLMSTGFGLMGVAAVPSGAGAASTLIVVAVVVYTFGEIMHAPAASSMALAAAGDAARGRYLGVYQLSWASAAAVAPALFGVLVTRCPLVLLAGLIVSDLLAVRLLGAATSTAKRRARRAGSTHPARSLATASC